MHKPTYISIGPYHYKRDGLHKRSQEWKTFCENKVVRILNKAQNESLQLQENARSTAQNESLQLLENARSTAQNESLQLPENARSTVLDNMVTSIGIRVKKYYDETSFAKDVQELEYFKNMMKTDGCFLLVTTLLDESEFSAVEETNVHSGRNESEPSPTNSEAHDGNNVQKGRNESKPSPTNSEAHDGNNVQNVSNESDSDRRLQHYAPCNWMRSFCTLFKRKKQHTAAAQQNDGQNLAEQTAAVKKNSIPNKWDELFLYDEILFYDNQLPFIVMRGIYDLLHGTPVSPNNSSSDWSPSPESGQKIGKAFANSVLMKRYTTRELTDPGKSDNVLHLCHRLLVPKLAKNWNKDGIVKTGRWRRATEYRKLLVEFKKREVSTNGQAECISDVRVVGGNVVEIPTFDFSPESWRLLRNLMVLENVNEHLGRHITSYCNFISQLACTGADISLLAKKGIIVHTEASDEVAAKKLLNLCDQIIYVETDDYLKSCWDALEKHCQKKRWRTWAKVFGYKDWNNPLVWLGAVAAVVLLLCAMLQTAYTMKAYFKEQPSPLSSTGHN